MRESGCGVSVRIVMFFVFNLRHGPRLYKFQQPLPTAAVAVAATAIVLWKQVSTRESS